MPMNDYSVRQVIIALQNAHATAEIDAKHALENNDDSKYWAALGRRAAYQHALNIMELEAKP